MRSRSGDLLTELKTHSAAGLDFVALNDWKQTLDVEKLMLAEVWEQSSKQIQLWILPVIKLLAKL